MRSVSLKTAMLLSTTAAIRIQQRHCAWAFSTISRSFQIQHNHQRHPQQRQRQHIMTSRNLSSSNSNENTKPSPKVIPRAAVSILVRTTTNNSNDLPLYALVQRGKQPNYGIWSLPGGSIEVGESTVQAAKRELEEETRLVEGLKWHEGGSFATSDSIHYDEEDEHVTFHYVIAHVFAEAYSNENGLPALIADDDALAATWWTVEEINRGIEEQKVTGGVKRVIDRAELLYGAGFLSTV